MNDFIQLKTQSNVYEAETMVEGQVFPPCGFFIVNTLSRNIP